MTFTSCLWGHISDKKITQECGLIDVLESGDVVTVDMGFDTHHLLASKCVTLNIPIFFCEEKGIARRGSRNKKCCFRKYSCGESN